MNIKNKVLIADISLLLVAISWGSTFLMVQNALNFVGVFSFLFWRFLVAFIFMVAILFKFGVKFDRNSVLYGLFLGAFLFSDFALQTYALKFTLSSTVAFIVGLNVVIVPFLMLIFFKTKIGIFSFIGALLAILGLYFLSGASFGIRGLGEILSLSSALFFAFHVIFTGKFAKICNIYILICTQFFMVAFLSLVFAINFDKILPNSVQIIRNLQISYEINFIIVVFLTSIFATVIAFFIQTFAQIYTTPAKTALILTFEPVSAGILGYLWGEKLLMIQIFGAILIIFAILLSEVGNLIFKNKKI